MVITLYFMPKFCKKNNYESSIILVKTFEIKRDIVGFRSSYIDILHQVWENSEALKYIFDTPSNITKVSRT